MFTFKARWKALSFFILTKSWTWVKSVYLKSWSLQLVVQPWKCQKSVFEIPYKQIFTCFHRTYNLQIWWVWMLCCHHLPWCCGLSSHVSFFNVLGLHRVPLADHADLCHFESDLSCSMRMKLHDSPPESWYLIQKQSDFSAMEGNGEEVFPDVPPQASFYLRYIIVFVTWNFKKLQKVWVVMGDSNSPHLR